MSEGFSAWIYEEFYSLWKEWFTVIDTQYGGNAHEYFKSTGSYSFSLTEKIRIIILNTMYCSRKNFWNLYQPQDLGGQLSFLVSELRNAESRGQSAHIIGHNPPNKECTESWLRNYIRVLDRFKSVITGSFFGHTHKDHFYLYFGEREDDAYATAFVSGSITTFGHVNPCYKIYTMSDKVSFSIANFLTATVSRNLVSCLFPAFPSLPPLHQFVYLFRSSGSISHKHDSLIRSESLIQKVHVRFVVTRTIVDA